MIFKTYIKEAIEPVEKTEVKEQEELIEETFEHPDSPSLTRDLVDAFYAPVEKLIKDGKFEEAEKEIEELEKDLAAFEEENAKKKIFKFPKFMIDGQKKQLAALRAKLPKTESLDDMDKRCEKCNTLLNDGGTCPKCDDGEEDLAEAVSNKEKLKRAFPELNFDRTEPITEGKYGKLTAPSEDLEFLANEFDKELSKAGFDYEISIKDGFKINIVSNQFNDIKDFAEKHFKKHHLSMDIEELDGSFNIMLKKEETEAQESLEETLTAKSKLINAFPHINWAFKDASISDSNMEEEFEEYDDEYDIDDDVEQDRRHAALYGGDRMYCDCGTKLSMDEWGGYCPKCNPRDPKETYQESFDDDCSYIATETSYDIAEEIAALAAKELQLPAHEVEMLEHDINNLRSNEWVDTFSKLPDNSEAKQKFFNFAVTAEECYDDEI